MELFSDGRSNSFSTKSKEIKHPTSHRVIFTHCGALSFMDIASCSKCYTCIMCKNWKCEWRVTFPYCGGIQLNLWCPTRPYSWPILIKFKYATTWQYFLSIIVMLITPDCMLHLILSVNLCVLHCHLSCYKAFKNPILYIFVTYYLKCNMLFSMYFVANFRLGVEF